MDFKNIFLLSFTFNAVLAVERTVHVSSSVASSICNQQQEYINTGTLQSPVTSRPESEETAGCGWLTIPPMTRETQETISRRSCDELASQVEGQIKDMDESGEPSSSSRIVGGEVTKPNEFPTLISLYRLNKAPSDQYRVYLCGGSILSENWVLTATHCLNVQPDPFKLRIVAGAYNLSDNGTTETWQTRDVEKVIRHPKYGDFWEGYDVGLLRVKTPFVFDDTVQKVTLPKQDYQPKKGDQVTGVGRGGTSSSSGESPILIKANFTIVSEEGCQRAAGQGSAVFSYGEDGVPVQIGVISFGAGGASEEKSSSGVEPRTCAAIPGAPFGAAHVAKLVDWINENAVD